MDRNKVNLIKDQFIKLIMPDMAEYILDAYGIEITYFNIASVMKHITNPNNWGDDYYELLESALNMDEPYFYNWHADYGPCLFSSNKYPTEQEKKLFLDNECVRKDASRYKSFNYLRLDLINERNEEDILIDLDTEIDGENQVCFGDTFRVEIWLNKNEEPFCYLIIQD